MVEALMYKLGTFGVNLEGSGEVYCDNKSVVKKSSVPVSVLNKRTNVLYYHRVIEDQAPKTLRLGWISGEYNTAYLLIKTKLTGNMRHRMVE